MERFNAIGIMSGTSLDGVDIAFCSFDENNPGKFDIAFAETLPYSDEWTGKLSGAHLLKGEALAKLHAEYSGLIAKMVGQFCNKHNCHSPKLLAFHGHTLYHRPELGFTFQLGAGAILAALTGIPTVCDFRSGNIALGGQGAPLVPIGDAHLFSEFDACLNIGGIANISLTTNRKIVAFDICPANMLLNHYAKKLGHAFDRDGNWAAEGTVDTATLDALNQLPYYTTPPPKSLGREWFEENILPILNSAKLAPTDALATCCEHIAIQVRNAVPVGSAKKLLITGGGAHNRFLVSRLRHYLPMDIEVPDKRIVDFKEALVFAYLGWLRYRGKANCLSEYTGSSRDICAGSLHLP